MDLLWEVRLAQAADWLERGEGSVSEVAYGVGFKNLANFSQRFKASYGSSPTGWKKEHGT
jgi:AraC-like DNA-binding protein